MKPTSKLRFVERFIVDHHPTHATASPVRILQQWWAHDPDCYEDFLLKANGEWRDIPIEKEN